MKELLIMPRGGGKTKIIAGWVKDGRVNGEFDSGDRVMVVRSRLEKERVMAVHTLGCHEVETLSTILGGHYQQGLRNKTLYIDNFDVMMDAIFGASVEGASISADDRVELIETSDK